MSHACDYNVSNNSILLTLHIVIPFQSHYDNNNCNPSAKGQTIE